MQFVDPKIRNSLLELLNDIIIYFDIVKYTLKNMV